MFQRCHAKIECLGWIELSGEQPLFGFVEADRVAEIDFAEFLFAAAIVEEAVAFIDFLNRKLLALAVFDGIAYTKTDAAQRGVVAGVFPLLAAGIEFNGDGPGRNSDDRTEAQFRFALADPTLSGMEVAEHRTTQSNILFMAAPYRACTRRRSSMRYFPA
jgi:hypothetical protein